MPTLSLERQIRLEFALAKAIPGAIVVRMSAQPNQPSFIPCPAVGADTPESALLVLPAGYSDLRTPIEDLKLSPVGARALYRLKVVSWAGFGIDKKPDRGPAPARLDILVSSVSGGGDEATVVVYGGRLTKSILNMRGFGEGAVLVFVAEYRRYGAKVLLISPEFVSSWGFVRPEYRGIPGIVAGAVVADTLASVPIRQSVYQAAADHLVRSLSTSHEKLLSYIQKSVPFVTSVAGFLRLIHAPGTPEDGTKALEIAKQISIIEVRKHAMRHNNAKADEKALIPIDRSAMDAIILTMGLTLTAEQVAAIDTIVEEITSTKPSRILMSGDVGCGKTLTFCIPAAAAALAGAKVAIMAPTVPVAKQLHRQWTKRFPEIPACYVGAKGVITCDVAIGTVALEGATRKAGWVPNLLIVDEQHKFSTEQRRSISGPATHIIEVSATPIPRSLALSLFSGMTSVTLRKAPVEKQIRSHLVSHQENGEISAKIREVVASGKKVILLYTAVKKDAKSVTEAYARLEPIFGSRVAMVHGQMKEADRDAAMARFASGESPILCASTVIEVGVDVPGIALMVVNGADRLGVSQLHQLRGRLARDGGEADFYMLIRSIEDAAAETLDRLRAVRDTLDGFELAEKDMLLRGFGDVAGDYQTGSISTTFRMVNLLPNDFLSS
jgi:ATP-dependent DNA helicase RecG